MVSEKDVEEGISVDVPENRCDRVRAGAPEKGFSAAEVASASVQEQLVRAVAVADLVVESGDFIFVGRAEASCWGNSQLPSCFGCTPGPRVAA